MKKLKRIAIKCMSFISVSSILAGICVQSFGGKNNQILSAAAQESVKKVNANIKTNQEDFYDDSVIYKLPEGVAETQEISVIVEMSMNSLMDVYKLTSVRSTASEYVNSRAAREVADSISINRSSLIRKLNKSGVQYKLGATYDTVLSGFEITIQAKDFERVANLFDSSANLIVGETYLPAETQVIHNDVDVYDTGIFNTSKSEYQGDGVVVAVLDSGLDYTHSAFSVANFTTELEAFTLSNVSEKVSKTVASKFTAGLTGEDVYLNKKIPFAYDYADKDTDVLPTNSDHGTHVSGIITGKDEKITGVAPNAQLAFMKVFSDFATGAKTSWLLAALEDCVKLGVDVVNMSLGSGCGFAREVDEERVNEVYDSIRDAGISLVVSAGNAYHSAFGSEKNGNLGLTSNPDVGTVGSPSTYAASMSVASVDGVKTPYITFNGQVIYFNEASNSEAKSKDFVNEILSSPYMRENFGDDVQSHDFEYVTIPGLGQSSDYPQEPEFYEGKIVLVKRGTTTFEDKVRVALMEMGAAGIIIYNNVSGTISMSVGKDVGAVCSISQDEGEMLAAQGTGILKISKSQVAGPFMSDFSSWGPTSDLQIKPEITAHGGEITSAIPGQAYDVQSGTSMAAPNQSGATVLIRQYVKYSGTFGQSLSSQEVTKLVNQLMMSTTDIIMNKTGLPYAVRKQGAGLVNINKAVSSAAYVSTFAKDGSEMDKTKLELGDDKNKTGVYDNITIAINNVSNSSVTYDLSSVLITEGVSETYTGHSETTVTQEGYLLDRAVTTVTAVENGSNTGNTITIGANQTATVTFKVELAESEKKYINDSFANGMYVEGFIKLTAKNGTNIDMSVPMLAFFGDWTQAPIFDEEYYDTHTDELNDGIDLNEKVMADAYATRAIGGLYSDYIATLGTYYFEQAPLATKIAADKEHIAISNQEQGEGSSITSLEYVWAGLLRNVKEANITIVEASTGDIVFEKTTYNQRKSYGNGGSNIYYSSIDIDFKALEKNLKNNTKYLVTVKTYIDYGTKEEQDAANARNTFEFPLYIDFEAPIVTDVVYRREYDQNTQKTKLFADLSVYDNHYAMGLQLGQIVLNDDENSEYTFNMNTFGKYVTPVYSSYNSTSTVTVELTDYVADLKKSAGIQYNADGSYQIVENNNSFIVACYDYALNAATYEVRLPDEVLSMFFNEESITLNPNQTMAISKVLNIYPDATSEKEVWLETLDFTTSDKKVVEVKNQTILAKESGEATITAKGRMPDGTQISAQLKVKVNGPDDEGYYGGYTTPEVSEFKLTKYEVNNAFYGLSSSEREIGLNGGKYEFAERHLSMFPSEIVTLKPTLKKYFDERTTLYYESGDEEIATVDQNGKIVARAKGDTIITVSVLFDGNPTFYSEGVSITVKDPFTTSAIYLTAYKGLGGYVEIPDDRGITTINPYAFSNYEYVEKDLSAGDVIDDEDPYLIKQFYIGDDPEHELISDEYDRITKIKIPAGVTTIESYAFASLTALEEVVLPSTLTRIGAGAFLGCKNLKTINLENVKFINEDAFLNCVLLEKVNLAKIVAISNDAFRGCKLGDVVLPASAQSIGIGAFADNANLKSVQFDAEKVKLGANAFANCVQLKKIDVNAAVISSYAFVGCNNLETVRLGKDVAVIGEYAFADTNVAKFTLVNSNKNLKTEEDGALLLSKDGNQLVLVAPRYKGKMVNGNIGTVQTNASSIATGAFAGNRGIHHLIANNVTSVGAYAFSDCTQLESVQMDKLETIGEYAFANTNLSNISGLTQVKEIGAFAFAFAKIASLTIADETIVGDYAFAYNYLLKTLVIGNDVMLGEGAFYCPREIYAYEYVGGINPDYYTQYIYDVKDEQGNVVEKLTFYRYNYNVGVLSSLDSVTFGNNVSIGDYAFIGNGLLTTLTFGEGTVIGNFAFYDLANLTNVELGNVQAIGNGAFSTGTAVYDMWKYNEQWSYAYDLQMINGKLSASNYKMQYFAPKFTTADLTNVTTLGEGVFAKNDALSNVTLGEGLQSVPNYTFADCAGLEEITLPQTITSIGAQAFYGTQLKQMDLSYVGVIGDAAFAMTDIEKVTLKESVVIGENAFAYCATLDEIVNLEKAKQIGAYAFMGVAISELNLSGVESVGDYAFALSNVQTVKFGEESKLQSLGENPFFACFIQDFSKEELVKYGPDEVVVETKKIATYDVNQNVKVINGVLYQVVPNGLKLVCYPMAKADKEYVVADGTVRISARAFVGATLESVTLPISLKAIGDKAFYSCEKLAVVIFKSYKAPILEEEYNQSYLTMENLPIPGFMGEYKGLGISKYYMWNITSSYNNFYFGANFVNYIGHVEKTLVMVKPANGQNYNSFIFSQYFGQTVQGSNAATDETLKVIALIAALPETITLSSEPYIVAARAAYDSIPTTEQKALVENYNSVDYYSILTKAESMLVFLKMNAEDKNEVEVPPVEEGPSAFVTFMKNNAVGLIIAGCTGIAFVAYVFITKKARKVKNVREEESETESKEE